MTASMRRALRRPRGDAGLSLVEVLVAITLLSIVLTMTVAAFVRTNRATRRTTDEADGLADVRTVTERLAKDALAARGVDPDPTRSNASKLTLWVDYDSNYVQSNAETVTWSLVANATDSNHFDIVRSTLAGDSKVIGRTLVSNLAFEYDTVTASVLTKTVTVQMTYDANVGGAAGTRTVNFRVRLRNVGDA